MNVEFTAGFYISGVSSSGSPTTSLKNDFLNEFLVSRVAVIKPINSLILLRNDGGSVLFAISSVSWVVSGNQAFYTINYSPLAGFTITGIMLNSSAITYFISGMTYIFYGGGSYRISVNIGVNASWTVSLITGGITYSISASNIGFTTLILRRIIGTYTTAVFPYAMRPNASNVGYFSYNTISLIYFTSVSLTTISSVITVGGITTDQTLYVVNLNRTLASNQWLYFTMSLVIL